MTLNFKPFCCQMALLTALVVVIASTTSAWMSAFDRTTPRQQREQKKHRQPSYSFKTATNKISSRTETSLRESSSSSSSSYNRLEDITSLNNEYFALRHGQSLANVAGIIASNPKIACHKYGLSNAGKEQAKKAGRDVIEQYTNSSSSHYEGILILTSDLLRAKETADIVFQQIVKDPSIDNHQVKIVLMETRLRERNFGEWDLQGDTHYQDVWQDDVLDPNHEINGVESVNQVTARATQMIIEWDNKQDLELQNHMIVCVAHGDVLQILQTAFMKMDPSQHRSLDHLETATLRPLKLW